MTFIMSLTCNEPGCQARVSHPFNPQLTVALLAEAQRLGWETAIGGLHFCPLHRTT